MHAARPSVELDTVSPPAVTVAELAIGREPTHSADVKRPMGHRMNPSIARVRTLCAWLRVSIARARLAR